MDLGLKWRFFKSQFGSDDDAERVYRWHIEARSGSRLDADIPTDRWKTKIDDYVGAAKSLWQSMSSTGFNKAHPVPIDPNGELLDGSHRVACALALDITNIWVELRPDYVWAPAWDYFWFLNAKMPKDDMRRLLITDWYNLNGGNSRRPTGS